MDDLTTDTVPLMVLDDTAVLDLSHHRKYVIRIDERNGDVHLVEADSQASGV